MRILVLNPNSSVDVTAAIDETVDVLRFGDGPEIVVDRLSDGPPGIATQIDADSVVMPLVQTIQAYDAQAFVIACFSDPGLHAVREAANGRPVVGIAECGITHALTRGDRFGIIALSEMSAQRQTRYVRQMGLTDRFAGSWPINASAADTTGTDIFSRLAEAGRNLVTERSADVIVMGCAGMARHRAKLEQAIGRPVIEPVQQGVLTAIGRLRLTHETE